MTEKHIKSEKQILKQIHKFINEDEIQNTWESKLAQQYDEKLFKDFAIGDLSHHHKGRIGLRWRTEREALIGKGEKICGEKGCNSKFGLESFEVLFNYLEQDEEKETLVKLILCSSCAPKLEKYKKITANSSSDLSKKKKKIKKRSRSRE